MYCFQRFYEFDQTRSNFVVIYPSLLLTIITRIIVSLMFKNVIIRAAVLFSEILRLWLNRNKSCHYLTKTIITRIIMYLVFKNVIKRIEIIVFRDFMTLVK